MQAARERRRAEVRRPAVHVQPRAGRALLPLSLPAAAVVARGHAELRGDRDPGRGDGRDWEFAGSRSHQDHRRVARQVVSLSLSLIQLAGKKGFIKRESRTRTNYLFCSGVVGADEQPSLLVYAALGVPPFRSIKLRKRRATCPACGTEGDKVGKIEETDYVQFCGGARPDWEALGLLNPRDAESRITANVGC